MSDELVPEVVEEAAEKKRTRRKKEALIVIEHGFYLRLSDGQVAPLMGR